MIYLLILIADTRRILTILIAITFIFGFEKHTPADGTQTLNDNYLYYTFVR